MAHGVEWTESAVAGVIDAIEYIAHDSPNYAAALAVRVEHAAASLRDLPHRGRRVPEYNDPDVREVIVGSTYRLIYRVRPHVVSVLAFVHTARDLARLLDE